ncbi:uncharacterized protein LOC133825510 [Humulus lupulus]|uniref:uncharacterized protein LOC133825510 n=1 Tax=Humulus lupulus TaxID=3486 RepID=UPI002B40D5C7|nr:uncharacterized protein LOC133825510 [Humulus lupulus]
MEIEIPFQKAWGDLKRFEKTVKNGWNEVEYGSGVYNVKNHILNCGRKLDKWNKKKKKEFKEKVYGLNQRITYLSNFHNRKDWREHKGLERKLKVMMEKEEQYWKQRSRALLLKEGDRNIKKVHKNANIRRKNNEIFGLFEEDLKWVDYEDELIRVACN